MKPDYANKHEKAAALIAVKGHPLYTFTQENNALSELIEQVRASGEIEAIRGISVHYAKKGDLLYPLLKAKYDIAGPSDLMWTDDDEIRDEISALAKEAERGENWNNRLNAVLDKAEQMIVKDQRVLFPICAVNFTDVDCC